LKGIKSLWIDINDYLLKEFSGCGTCSHAPGGRFLSKKKDTAKMMLLISERASGALFPILLIR
jgi:hypothetical protein